MSETLAGATGLEPATNASWRSQQIQWRRSWSPKPQIFFENRVWKTWQGRQDSNLQPTVLETATLPIEPRPCIDRSLGLYHNILEDK